MLPMLKKPHKPKPLVPNHAGMHKAKPQCVRERQQLCAPGPRLLSTVQLRGKSSLHARALVHEEPQGHAVTGITGNSKPQLWEESNQEEVLKSALPGHPGSCLYALPQPVMEQGDPWKATVAFHLGATPKSPSAFSFPTTMRWNCHHTKVFRHRSKGQESQTVQAMVLCNQAKREKWKGP